MQQITRTVTGKGQVTIPKQIRERLGIDADDKITFVVDDEGQVELRPAHDQWKDLRGIIPPTAGEDSIDFRDAFEHVTQERGDDLMSGRRE